jgi:hypothetical protein
VFKKIPQLRPPHQTSKTPKKGWITFITSIYIILCRRRISASNGSKILSQVKSSNNATSISIVKVMDVVKAF